MSAFRGPLIFFVCGVTAVFALVPLCALGAAWIVWVASWFGI